MACLLETLYGSALLSPKRKCSKAEVRELILKEHKKNPLVATFVPHIGDELIRIYCTRFNKAFLHQIALSGFFESSSPLSLPSISVRSKTIAEMRVLALAKEDGGGGDIPKVFAIENTASRLSIALKLRLRAAEYENKLKDPLHFLDPWPVLRLDIEIPFLLREYAKRLESFK